MSLSLSLNKQCSRCPRMEQKPITLDEAVAQAKSNKKAPPALEIRIDGETLVEFEALCDICQSIVLRYVENAGKKPKHQSALREQSEIRVEQE
jgi:hypothetical protein